jgi:hypothetical protein
MPTDSLGQRWLLAQLVKQRISAVLGPQMRVLVALDPATLTAKSHVRQSMILMPALAKEALSWRCKASC